METSSPARLYALLVGGVLTIAGIIGFFYDSSFDTGAELRADEVFGILAVNGWHNVVHLVTGLLGLAAVGYAARAYALVLGLVYMVVAIWGFSVTRSSYQATVSESISMIRGWAPRRQSARSSAWPGGRRSCEAPR